MERIRGSELPANLQRAALNQFVHRCTADHIPLWALRGPGSGPYRTQFANDAEWLKNTFFYVTNGGKLSARKHCESYPTWHGHFVK